MGALHEGHLSLIETAIHENEFVVASIFVTPTQFNDSNDFESFTHLIFYFQKPSIGKAYSYIKLNFPRILYIIK